MVPTVAVIVLGLVSCSRPHGPARHPSYPRPYLREMVSPREPAVYDRTGLATWFRPRLGWTRTAIGELLPPHALTAAHPTLPLPSYGEVTNLDNGCVIIVRINDRGPFLAGHVLAVSERAAHLLRFRIHGRAEVRVRYLGPASRSGDTSYEEHYLRRFPDLGCEDRRPAYRRGRSYPLFSDPID